MRASPFQKQLLACLGGAALRPYKPALAARILVDNSSVPVREEVGVSGWTGENWTPSSLVVWLEAYASISPGLGGLLYDGSGTATLLLHSLLLWLQGGTWGRLCVPFLWPSQHHHRLGVYYRVVLEAARVSKHTPGQLQCESFSSPAATMAAGIAWLVTAWLQALPPANASSSPAVSLGMWGAVRKSRLISSSDLS